MSTKLIPRINGSNPLWTVFGGICVLNNVFNWKRPYWHTSALARRHPVVTTSIMAAYLYHFIGPTGDHNANACPRHRNGT